MDLGQWLSLVGAGVGVLGLLFGLYQYYVAQKWKRAEFAAAELERLHADPELALCCTMLDWAARRIGVPEKYAELTDETTFVHTWELLERSMQPESAQGEFPWPGIVYRDVFDRMFAYLASVENFLRVRLIDRSHVEPLEYWLREIARPRFASEAGRGVLLRFLAAYDYTEVLELMKRFEIDTATSPPPPT